MSTANNAQIWAVVGASGCGKGLWMKERLRKLKPKRLIILDTKNENAEFGELMPSLAALAQASFGKEFRLRYIPRGLTKKARQDEFETLCRIVQAAKNCTFVIEELGRYTTPSYAPPAWADCCNDGRHDGLHIIGASQFPAQIDKSFLGNATVIHCGYLGEESARKVVAAKMDIEPGRIKALPNLAYLHFDRASRQVTEGVVRIPK